MKHCNALLPALVVLTMVLGCSAPARAQEEAVAVSQELLDLKAEYDAFVEQHPPEAFTPSHPQIRIRDGFVLIEAAASGETDALLDELKTLGLKEFAAYGRLVSGWLPISSIDELADLQHMRFVRVPMAETGNGLVPGEEAEDFALEPGFPNPFTQKTSLVFAVAERVPVRLAIYDLLGRERDILVEENLNPGTYEVTWDATGVPSGNYLARLRAGPVVQTGLLTLAR